MILFLRRTFSNPKYKKRVWIGCAFMLYFSTTAISLPSYCNLREQRIHNTNSRSFKSTQLFMFKGGISTFLLKLPGCADKAAIICSDLTLLCGWRWNDKIHGDSREPELSIPYRALRVPPRQAVRGAGCALVWTCSGTSHTHCALPKFLGPSVEIPPCQRQWMCWAAGDGAGPEDLAARLLESSSCSEHGCVLEQLTLRKCWKAPPGEMKSHLWGFIWGFVLSLCRGIIVTTTHSCFVHRLDGYRQKSGFLK